MKQPKAHPVSVHIHRLRLHIIFFYFTLLYSLSLLAITVSAFVLVYRYIKLVGGGQLQSSVIHILLIEIAVAEDGNRLMM